MTLDTNIIIAYLAGDSNIIATLSYWREMGKALFLPTIVEAEVLSFNDWTNEERHQTEKFLEENFTTIAFDRQLSRLTASIRRQNKIKLPDATIAATAIFTRTPLVTRNVRDFNKIRELQVLVI